MYRSHFEDEHISLGNSFRNFLDKVIVPHQAEYDRAGIVPREIFEEAGRSGFLGLQVPEEFGGGGTSDFRFNQIIDEQIAAAGVGGTGLGFSLHNDMCGPYFTSYCTDDQKRRWLPGIASGSLITAVAMTEPNSGSDLAGMRTSAERDGDHYILNGSKTFITNGINADLVIVACRTDVAAGDRRSGITLLVLERGMKGFERGRNLEKLGLHSQDTAELAFTNVRVPIENRLGDEGEGFAYLSANLPQERLSIAISGLAEARAALDETLRYAKDRTAFGKTIGSFQHTKFTLAEAATEIDVAQSYVDNCVNRLSNGDLSTADASKAKYYCTELQGRVVDRCLQIHGGYGYMTAYSIAQRYANARVTRIYGGTSEIMKTVIAKSLEL